MKKITLAVLFVVYSIFAITNPSLPVDVTTKDTLTRANFDANWDTIYTWAARMNDTVDKKFLRTAAADDSTWLRLRVDSIRSNPNIDSISGNPWVSGTVREDSGFAVKGYHSKKGYLDTTISDSTKSRAFKGTKATLDTIFVDSTKSRAFKGTKANIDTIVTDSIKTRTLKTTSFKPDSISTRIINTTQIEAGIDSGIITDTLLFHYLGAWAHVGDNYATHVNINGANIKGYNVWAHAVYDTSFMRTSGSFVINLTGLTVALLDTIRWIKQGYPSGDTIVYLFFNTKSGTSNSTAFASDTTFPTEVRPTGSFGKIIPTIMRDGTTTYQNGAILLNTNGTVVFYITDQYYGQLTLTWTNSGTKGYHAAVISYKK